MIAGFRRYKSNCCRVEKVHIELLRISRTRNYILLRCIKMLSLMTKKTDSFFLISNSYVKYYKNNSNSFH